MRKLFHTESRARLRIWLLIGYTIFIVYVSLSPFAHWHEQGLDFLEVLKAPLAQTFTAFDSAVNLLAYVPFGFLACMVLRARSGARAGVMLALCAGVTLSASMEYLQMYLPMRTSSNLDLLTNSAGTLIGAVLASSMASWRWFFPRLTSWRQELFLHGKDTDFGLALLAVWLFGQINPTRPILGNIFIRETDPQPFVALSPAPFDLCESGVIALNVLMVGVLLLTLLRVPSRVITALLVVLCVVVLGKFIVAALLLKSWAMFVWFNGEAVLGMMLGMVLLLAVPLLSRNAAIGLGVAVALSYFAIVNFLFGDNHPIASMSIYHWHYRHLLYYNRLAQTITLAFPALLLIHLWRVRKL